MGNKEGSLSRQPPGGGKGGEESGSGPCKRKREMGTLSQEAQLKKKRSERRRVEKDTGEGLFWKRGKTNTGVKYGGGKVRKRGKEGGVNSVQKVHSLDD